MNPYEAMISPWIGILINDNSLYDEYSLDEFMVPKKDTKNPYLSFPFWFTRSVVESKHILLLGLGDLV